MVLHLNIVGTLCIVLALVHVVFPGYFNWKQELRAVSLINRQMMYVHTFFVALVVLLIGLLCVTSATDLLQTRLGHWLALGLFIFWGLRLLIQFFGYSPELWRGKRMETIVHVLFAGLWTYFSAVFLAVYWFGR